MRTEEAAIAEACRYCGDTQDLNVIESYTKVLSDDSPTEGPIVVGYLCKRQACLDRWAGDIGDDCPDGAACCVGCRCEINGDPYTGPECTCSCNENGDCGGDTDSCAAACRAATEPEEQADG